LETNGIVGNDEKDRLSKLMKEEPYSGI